MSASPIAAALQAFETERANLLARVAKLDALIMQTRDAFHLPATAPAKRAQPPAARNGRAAVDASDVANELPASVVAALKGGPLKTSELLERTGLSRYLVYQFVNQGLLTASGATASRRYSLPGVPAKEAP